MNFERVAPGATVVLLAGCLLVTVQAHHRHDTQRVGFDRS
jgi:hypothetical protein